MRFESLRDQLLTDVWQSYHGAPVSNDVLRGVREAMELCAGSVSLSDFERRLVINLRQETTADGLSSAAPWPLHTETKHHVLAFLDNCFNFLASNGEHPPEVAEFATRSMLRTIARKGAEVP